MDRKSLLLILGVCVILIWVRDGEGWWRRRRRRRHPRPVACGVSNWQSWGKCSRTCDRGTQKRSRRITQHPRHGGRGCPALSETRSCKLHPCPCKVSAWSAWSPCTKSCDSGKHRRSRKIVRPRSPGGAKCPALQETGRCNTFGCPCTVSNWGAWSACRNDRWAWCWGVGVNIRQRRVRRPASPGGTCPALREKRGCKCKHPTCKATEWGSWSRCRKGNKRQTRSRIWRLSYLKFPICMTMKQSRVCVPKLW